MPPDDRPADLRDIGLILAGAKLRGYARDALLLRCGDARPGEPDPVGGVRQSDRIGVQVLPAAGCGARLRPQPFDRACPAVYPVIYRVICNSHVWTPEP
jgi:hypothetical protein